MRVSALRPWTVHGFDLARDAVVELQVLVCECVRSEVAQVVDSLRCVSEGAEHSGVNFPFPGFAVLTNALLNGTGLPALSTAELLVKFLGCTDVVGVQLLLTLVGCSTRILPLVVLEVAKCLVVYKRDCAMQTTFSFLTRRPNLRAVDDEVRNDALKSSLVFIIGRFRFFGLRIAKGTH